jgi:hypothetical protein
LAYDRLWVDEKAWGELAVLFEEALEKALAIGEEAAKRHRKDTGGFFLTSYALAMFESPMSSDL